MVLGIVTSISATPKDTTRHELTRNNLDTYLKKVVQNQSERAWKEIPWQNDFEFALYEANQTDKPVLLWVMNGDPLGCT